jgi:hypothetical protein
VDTIGTLWAPCVSVGAMTSKNSARPETVGTGQPDAELRLRLNRAAVVLWRSRSVVQLELGKRRIVLENVEPAQLSALLPRGSAGAPSIDSAGAPAHSELTAILNQAGFLTSAASRPATGRLATPARLSADLNALTAQFGDDAVPVLQARRSAAVAVHGTSRLAASVAATFAAAGVGWVQLVSGGEVSAGHSCPGGLLPTDEGHRFAVAAEEAVRRHAPEVNTGPIPPQRSADLVVLTDPVPLDPALRAALHQSRVPHLPATVDGQTATVGPLVLPGVSSCLRCADLHRTDRDPAWPALAVQLASRPLRRIGSDVALCVATVGVAVTQGLAFLDRAGLDRARPATLEGSLEWQLPDWRLRRRSWPAHHRCDCGAATATEEHGRMVP